MCFLCAMWTIMMNACGIPNSYSPGKPPMVFQTCCQTCPPGLGRQVGSGPVPHQGSPRRYPWACRTGQSYDWPEIDRGSGSIRLGQTYPLLLPDMHTWCHTCYNSSVAAKMGGQALPYDASDTQACEVTLWKGCVTLVQIAKMGGQADKVG